MKFINTDPLTMFEEINLETTTLQDYKKGILLPHPLTDINITNYFLVCKYAIKQFDFLLKNENLSEYYLVDWRVIYSSLQEFILESKRLLDNKEIADEFIHKYDDLSVEILYNRLSI